jgi:hypothetical protein
VQHAPVGHAAAGGTRLEERLDALLQDRPYLARLRVRDVERYVPVVARDRSEGDGAPVRIPLRVTPRVASHHAAAARGALVIRGRLQSQQLPADDVDDDPLVHGHGGITGKGVGPAVKARRRLGRLQQMQRSNAALVETVRQHAPSVGRPADRRSLAATPALVVGGVAVALDAVARQRANLVALGVTHPQVVVLTMERVAAVRREHGAGCELLGRGGALAAVCHDVTRPAAAIQHETEAPAVVARAQLLERQRERFVLAARRLAENLREALVIERPLARAASRIDDHELVALRNAVAVPETIARQPDRLHLGPQDQRVHVPAQEPLGARVAVGADAGGRRLRESGGYRDHEHRAGDGHGSPQGGRHATSAVIR